MTSFEPTGATPSAAFPAASAAAQPTASPATPPALAHPHLAGLANPHMQRGYKPRNPARTHFWIGVTLAVAALAYSALVAWRLALDVREIHLIRQVLDAPTLVSRDDVTSLAHRESMVDDLSLLIFFGVFITMMIWRRNVQATLARVGQGAALRNSAAYLVWRIAVWSSLVAVLFLHTSASSSLDAAVAADQRAIGFACGRVAIGVLYTWLALSTGRAVASAFAPSDDSIKLVRIDQAPAQGDIYQQANADYAPDGTRLTQPVQ